MGNGKSTDYRSDSIDGQCCKHNERCRHDFPRTKCRKWLAVLEMRTFLGCQQRNQAIWLPRDLNRSHIFELLSQDDHTIHAETFRHCYPEEEAYDVGGTELAAGLVLTSQDRSDRDMAYYDIMFRGSAEAKIGFLCAFVVTYGDVTIIPYSTVSYGMPISHDKAYCREVGDRFIWALDCHTCIFKDNPTIEEVLAIPSSADDDAQQYIIIKDYNEFMTGFRVGLNLDMFWIYKTEIKVSRILKRRSVNCKCYACRTQAVNLNPGLDGFRAGDAEAYWCRLP